jgi:[ribosomal protein S5]-alanine N-acetyltransferase
MRIGFLIKTLQMKAKKKILVSDLISRNVILREFRHSDKITLAFLCNNKNISDNLRDIVPYPYSVKDAENFIEKCLNENPPTTFIIDYNGNLAGCIGLVLQTYIYRLSAEIGYWIGEPYWGQGLATEAVKQIVDYGFNSLGLVRIFSGVFAHNISSQRVLEKAGFKFECVAEKALIKNGVIYDEKRYSLTK